MKRFEEYANAIIESQGCEYCGHDEDRDAECYQNDELGMRVRTNYRSPWTGEMIVRFKSESDPNSRKRIEITANSWSQGSNYTKFFIASSIQGCNAGVYINTPKFNERNGAPVIEIHRFNTRAIKIKLEIKGSNDEIKVLVYDDYTDELIGEIGIEQLSDELFVNKIFEILQSDIKGDLLEWFKEVFEIIRPALLLRIEEVIREWHRIITRPVEAAQKRIREIDEQIAALTQERNSRIEYLSDMEDKFEEMYLLCAAERDTKNDGSKKA